MTSDERRVILVVDDDQDVCEVVSVVLAREGLRVVTAADGDEALDWLRHNPRPALILLDWIMPRCDGAAFRAAQSASAELADIPVVLMSSDPEITERQRQLKAAAFLPKPVHPHTLRAVVEACAARG